MRTLAQIGAIVVIGAPIDLATRYKESLKKLLLRHDLRV
jgi:hypothetical protein